MCADECVEIGMSIRRESHILATNEHGFTNTGAVCSRDERMSEPTCHAEVIFIFSLGEENRSSLEKFDWRTSRFGVFKEGSGGVLCDVFHDNLVAICRPGIDKRNQMSTE